MIRVLTLFLLSFGIILNVAAQRTHTIKGKVIDKNSRQPLEFINILLIGQDMGAVTDATGEYTIDEVKPGIYKLQASSGGCTFNISQCNKILLHVILNCFY